MLATTIQLRIKHEWTSCAFLHFCLWCGATRTSERENEECEKRIINDLSIDISDRVARHREFRQKRQLRLPLFRRRRDRAA